MSERIAPQEALTGFAEMVEPIRIVEIGCGIGFSGGILNHKMGRLYDLPFEYSGIEREEEFAHSVDHKSEEEKTAARTRAQEAGVILGNAANLPFPDESVDVVTMRSVFGQFTGKDFREFDNVMRFGLMEIFRVLRLNGIIAISEENTPWDADNVFHRLTALGFTVIDYSAMQSEWRAPEGRDWSGRPVGDYRNVYAPENEEWLRKLGQFYGGDDSRTDFLSTPRQYLMVGQKQQPATVEQSLGWQQWSVPSERYNDRDSESTPEQKTYTYGEPVTQEFLPGMYAPHPYNSDQQQLFYMQPRHWLYC